MIIYLYLKTHNKTGLKYLGKTIQDPIVYRGSGHYWLRHIKVHGYDVTTEILRECSSNEEIKEWGLHYSQLWDIVNSKEFANLKLEYGNGGPPSEESKKKIGKVLSEIKSDLIWKETIGEEANRKMLETRNSKEWIEEVGIPARIKRLETMHSDEWLQTVGANKSKLISEKAKIRCNDPLWQSTSGEERKRKERIKRTDPVWLATVEVNRIRKLKETLSSKEYKESRYTKCKYCDKYVDPGNYKLHHGENCKKSLNKIEGSI
jgi:hypothetical protein